MGSKYFSDGLKKVLTSIPQHYIIRASFLRVVSSVGRAADF